MKEFNEFRGLRRHAGNPILTAKDVPYESALVFNAGITKFNGKYVMAFRNDYGCDPASYAAGTGSLTGTNIGLAYSDDGLSWDVAPKPCFTHSGVGRGYDPRLTVIDGRCYMCFAVDGEGEGVKGGIAVTDDLENFEVLHLTEPDNRNMVLFPEKIGGEFVRLDRPFPVYGKGGGEYFDTWLSRSPDCRYWGRHERLLTHTDIPFCNCKTGPGAPPVRTPAGWLTTFHAVWKLDTPELASWDSAGWNKLYYGGIMLLDLENPARIKGICPEPLVAPREDYELNGFRGGVIFPGGMILEDSGEVKIYYGAADTVECLASADVGELIDACLRNR